MKLYIVLILFISMSYTAFAGVDLAMTSKVPHLESRIEAFHLALNSIGSENKLRRIQDKRKALFREIESKGLNGSSPQHQQAILLQEAEGMLISDKVPELKNEAEAVLYGLILKKKESDLETLRKFVEKNDKYETPYSMALSLAQKTDADNSMIPEFNDEWEAMEFGLTETRRAMINLISIRMNEIVKRIEDLQEESKLGISVDGEIYELVKEYNLYRIAVDFFETNRKVGSTQVASCVPMKGE